MNPLRLSKSVAIIQEHGLLLIGLGLLGFLGAMALMGLVLSIQDPSIRGIPFQSPSLDHPLGTDDLGQDLLYLLLRATPGSILVGLASGVISVVFGTAVGLTAGYVQKIWSETLNGLIDVVLLIPILPFMILLTAYVGPGFGTIILAVGCLGWGPTARAVRAKTLQLKATLFVEALVALGFSQLRIVFRHLLPNVWDVVSARFVLSVASAILSEAALSFMGLGDPVRPSWGKMMYFAFHRGGFANGLWTWYVPPGLCIAACCLGLTLIGIWMETRDREAPIKGEWLVKENLPAAP